MAAAALPIEALGRTQDRQKGQRPDPLGPGERRQQHTRQPAQATGFDQMRVRGAHGVTVDAFGFNPLAASPLDGIIQATHHDTRRDEHRYHEPEEQPTGGERRPDGAIEDPMIRLKVGGCAASHNLENRGDRPLPRRKNGAGEEHFDVLPHGSGKDGGKDTNNTGEGDR
jgi:hypothetical protein